MSGRVYGERLFTDQQLIDEYNHANKMKNLNIEPLSNEALIELTKDYFTTVQFDTVQGNHKWQRIETMVYDWDKALIEHRIMIARVILYSHEMEVFQSGGTEINCQIAGFVEKVGRLPAPGKELTIRAMDWFRFEPGKPWNGGWESGRLKSKIRIEINVGATSIEERIARIFAAQFYNGIQYGKIAERRHFNSFEHYFKETRNEWLAVAATVKQIANSETIKKPPDDRPPFLRKIMD